MCTAIHSKISSMEGKHSIQPQILIFVSSKRLLSTVFHQMELQGVRTRQLWHEIKMIIVKTVLAMVPEIMVNYEQ